MQDLERKDWNEVDDEPAAKVTKSYFFVVPHNLLFLHVPVALEKREHEVCVEERFDHPEYDQPLVCLLDWKRHVQYTIYAGVRNQQKDKNIEYWLPSTIWRNNQLLQETVRIRLILQLELLTHRLVIFWLVSIILILILCELVLIYLHGHTLPVETTYLS